MNNRAWMVVVLMALVLVQMALADVPQANHRWEFENNYRDENLTTNLSSAGSGNTFNSTVKKLGSYAIDLNGAGWAYSNYAPNGMSTGNVNLTEVCWAYIDNVGAQVQFILDGYVTTNDQNIFLFYNPGHLKLTGAATSGDIDLSLTLNTSQWYFIGFRYNATSKVNNIWLDERQVATATRTNNLNLQYPSTGNTGRYVTGGYAHTGTSDAKYDGCRKYESYLNDTQMLEIYNSGSGTTSDPITQGGNVTPPTFVYPTPDDADHNNTQATINISCDSGLTKYLYFDSSTNPTTAVLSNSSSSSYTTSVADGTYYYKAACYNATSNFQSTNTSVRSWVYDTTFPTITLSSSGNEWNANNVTVLNAYDKVLNISLTFADNIALFGYRINVTRAGVIYFNETNVTLSGTSATVTKGLNIVSWPAGSYNVEVLVEDSHTAKAIPDYQVTPRKSGITFKTQTENNIKVETEQAASINASKQVDRYLFDVSFDDGLTRDRMFHVKTDKCPLYVPASSPFKGHLVAFCGNDGNWIDFEGVAGIPVINKIDDYHYTVYFSNIASKVTFRSIGGLNSWSANYSFYVGNYSFNNDFALAGESRTLAINLSRDSTIGSIAAVLYYDGVLQTGVAQINNSDWVYFSHTAAAPNLTTVSNFTWNVTINNSDETGYTFNVSANQSVYEFGINNCSGVATNVTLQINYYVENSPSTALSNSLEVTLETWVDDPDNSFTYTATYSSATSHTLCIFPSSATLYADAYFKYTSADGFVHRYYLLNHSFTNSTQSLSLFNWNETSSTSILKLTTRRLSDYTYFKNVVVTLQREYVGEGVWRNVQMDESGDFGLVNFNILERTTDYRLLFVDRSNGRVLKQTQRLKFVCSSGVCDLTYLLNPNSSSSASEDVNFTFSYNNATRNITVNWSDNSGLTQTVRLFVWKNTITGLTTVCDTTQTANAGSIVCDTSSYQGQVYVSLRQNDDLIWGEYLDLAKTTLGSKISQAEGGFWTLGIMIVTIAFGLFSPVGAIIGGVIGLFIVFFLGTFTVLTTTGIIIAVVIGAVLGFRLKQ